MFVFSCRTELCCLCFVRCVAPEFRQGMDVYHLVGALLLELQPEQTFTESYSAVLILTAAH